MNEIEIITVNGMQCVSSLQVAEDFGKKHKHVLEAIENIKAENSAVTPMFIESTYRAGTGKNYKCYDITRDGFSLLAMGFTGAEALEWKLRYIEAFNRMEQTISTEMLRIETLKAKATADIAEAQLIKAKADLLNAETGKARLVHEIMKYDEERVRRLVYDEKQAEQAPKYKWKSVVDKADLEV